MNVLVISPHPDDETLGCGGTILKHKNNGEQLFWLIMTKMTTEVGYSEEQMRTRAEEIKMVAEAYQFEKMFQLDFATTALDIVARRELIGAVSKVVDEVKPEIIYFPCRFDIHSDHKVTFEVVTGAIKTFRAPSIERVFVYEVISETEFAPPLQSEVFLPNSFSNISAYLENKVEIMKLYKSELGNLPFPRSEENIRALATFRGATVGVKYAEAFMMIKERW